MYLHRFGRTNYRSLAWNAAVRDLRKVDLPGTAAERRAADHAARIEAIQAKGGIAEKLWTPAGGFDRSRIMARAVRIARANRLANPHLTWAAAMAETLSYAWSLAHAARRAGVN